MHGKGVGEGFRSWEMHFRFMIRKIFQNGKQNLSQVAWPRENKIPNWKKYIYIYYIEELETPVKWLFPIRFECAVKQTYGDYSMRTTELIHAFPDYSIITDSIVRNQCSMNRVEQRTYIILTYWNPLPSSSFSSPSLSKTPSPNPTARSVSARGNHHTKSAWHLALPCFSRTESNFVGFGRCIIRKKSWMDRGASWWGSWERLLLGVGGLGDFGGSLRGEGGGGEMSDLGWAKERKMGDEGESIERDGSSWWIGKSMWK